MTAVGVVGAGRAGVGLALALTQAGHSVRVHARRGKRVPPPLVLSWGGAPPWLAEVEVVLVAVRDGDIAAAASELAGAGGVTDAHAVLHLSGLRDAAPLEVLRPSGAALGCWHPLQAIAHPEDAPERLRGAVAALSGDPRAVAVAEFLARDLGMHPVVLDGAAKPRYHAAAAIASNYMVVLAAMAERLMTEAGVPPDTARAGIATLMQGTLANIRTDGAAALTGPIVRGDVETVRVHLDVLPPELRDAYRALGRATLTIAGLDGAVADRFRDLL
ncbi:MAG: DUF2520 domain-containing protein [Gemmatimonadota bacterium]|nr:DUF2520 domain-containing protein [Gemmatimonadota bacterium]MDH4350849.1 DUF2520 domain-containing protein [Gemmatimonadota bacterium]MDH5196606.1 DUF2520 domain-containing protein [Gemmatimonadota bacterium]